MNKKEICAFSAALVKTVRKYAPYTPNVPNAIFPDNRNEKLFSDYLLTTEMMGRGLIGDCYGDNNTGFYVFENQAQMAHDLNRVSAGICGNLTMFACFLARITDIDKAYEISIAPVTIAKYHVLLVIYNNAYKNTLASSHEFKSMKHLCETFPDRKAAICDPWFWLSTSVEDYKSFCAKADSYQADYLYSLDDYNPDSYEDDLYENETISVRYPIPVSDQTARNDINTPFINLNRFRSELSQQYIHNFNSSVQKFDVPLHQIRMLSINNKSKVRAHYITYLNMRNHKWLYEIPALSLQYS
ncbi:MAG: hypothetical protein GY718_08455 [Lentisphaerae bacterium]|nr:hypothetical protein [Lentisphaerota bacterium]